MRNQLAVEQCSFGEHDFLFVKARLEYDSTVVGKQGIALYAKKWPRDRVCRYATGLRKLISAGGHGSFIHPRMLYITAKPR